MVVTVLFDIQFQHYFKLFSRCSWEKKGNRENLSVWWIIIMPWSRGHIKWKKQYQTYIICCYKWWSMLPLLYHIQEICMLLCIEIIALVHSVIVMVCILISNSNYLSHDFAYTIRLILIVTYHVLELFTSKNLEPKFTLDFYISKAWRKWTRKGFDALDIIIQCDIILWFHFISWAYPIGSTNDWVIFSIDIQQASSLISNLQEQEAILKQCIEQLESVDAARITLINHLKEALSEQVLSTFLIIFQILFLKAYYLFLEKGNQPRPLHRLMHMDFIILLHSTTVYYKHSFIFFFAFL
jgi:hypothetical protein